MSFVKVSIYELTHGAGSTRNGSNDTHRQHIYFRFLAFKIKPVRWRVGGEIFTFRRNTYSIKLMIKYDKKKYKFDFDFDAK